MKIVLVLAITAAAFAAKEGSYDTVMPEEGFSAAFVEEGFSAAFVEKMHAHGAFAEASDRTSELLSLNAHLGTRARRSACQKAADASINNVFKEVQAAQKMLNRLDDGSKCGTKNQNLIDSAKSLVKRRQREVDKAKSNLQKAKRSRVTWNFSYDSLTEGSCGPFYKHQNWQNAKNVVQRMTKNLNKAQSNLSAAKTNLKLQIANAKRVRNQCYCDVRKNTNKQLKIAKTLTGERQKTILREMMVKCLVAARAKGRGANTAAAKCKNVRISSSYNNKLGLRRTSWASGVSSAGCGDFTIKLGAKGGVKAGTWEFKTILASKTPTNGDARTASRKECAKYGMKPLADNKGYSDGTSTTIGNAHHMAYVPYWKTTSYYPSGLMTKKKNFFNHKMCFYYKGSTSMLCQTSNSHTWHAYSTMRSQGYSYLCGQRLS